MQVAGFRHVGGGFRGSDMWVSGFARPREVKGGERWWSATESSSARDRRGPSLVRRRRTWRWWQAIIWALREEEGEVGKQRKERGSRVREREGVGVLFSGSQARQPPPLLF